MPTPLTDADKVIRNDTGISIANALTALAGVVRGGNENIGDAYNSSNSYSAGDYCIYENTLYKCTGATSGAWDSTKWDVTTIEEELLLKQNATDNSLDTTDKTITGAINEHHSVIGYSYDAYDDTATYAVGDLCIYNNTLWKCTTANSNQEPVSGSTYWDDTSVADEISELKSDTTANFDYTANETLIGDYFGYPLYRKYFEIGALPNNTTKTVDILDFTIRDVVDFRCIAKTTNSQSFVTLPYVSTQSTFNILCDIECTNGKTKVNITTQMDRTGMVAFGIIDYRKWSN